MILCGDIGATKSLLGLVEKRDGPLSPRWVERHVNAHWPAFDDLLRHFLAEGAARLGREIRLDAAGFGMAGPVEAGRVTMTNLPWRIDAARLGADTLGGCPVSLLNDLEAAALGIDDLEAGALLTLQTGLPLAGAPQLVVGAGSGLGVALRLPTPAGTRVIAGEGGHAGFTPRNAEQLALWQHLHGRFDRVSAEHVVSGTGLARLHNWLAPDAPVADGEAAWRRAIEDGRPAARRALALFLDCYGAVVGDHALTSLARGGVYVVGAIAAQLLQGADGERFMAAFCDKGPLSALAARMPVHVVRDASLPLRGAARAALGLVKSA